MTALEAAQRYFPDRGVLEETFKRYHVEIVSSPTHEQLLGWLGENSYCLDAAVVFPNLIRDRDTGAIFIHAHHVRCFPPHVGPDGKARKFLATRGSRCRPYILPDSLDVAHDTAEPVYIVEKQAAALLLRQNGLHVIALDGTFGAAAKRVEDEPVKLHEALSEWDWVGRPLYLCFDSDFRKRQSVLQGLIRTYILFTIAGAVVKVLQWDAQFTGLDDYVAAKAGLDTEKQRAEVLALVSAVEGGAKEAASNWILPQYRGLFETEVAAIQPTEGQCSLLADIVHKALGGTPGDLKKSWRQLITPPETPTEGAVVVEDIEPWPDPVVPKDLAEALEAKWRRHLVTSDVNYWALVLWEILTHLKDHVSLMPILGIRSALPRCGKTRTLEVLNKSVWKPLFAASVSPAATIRTIEKYGPCFLIDEFDAFMATNEEFRGVLNTCHTRGMKHIRCAPETHEPQVFNAFCPVAVALIGNLPTTVLDRAIMLYLARKQVSQKVIPVRKVPAEEFVRLQRMTRRFALDNASEILSAFPVLPKLSNDRALENWETLAQIAAVLGNPWPFRAFTGAKDLTPGDNDNQEFKIQLLVSIRRLFWDRGFHVPGREEEPLFTSVILSELNKDPEAPWANKKEYSTGLTPHKLGSELREFGVKPHRNRPSRLHGYWWKDLAPVFKSVLSDDEEPPSPPPGGSPPPPPPSPETPFEPSSEGTELSCSEFSPETPDQIGTLGHPYSKTLGSSKLTPVPDRPKNRKRAEKMTDLGRGLTLSASSTSEEGVPVSQFESPLSASFCKSIPPSTPQAPFCASSHPERFLFLDIETFYPWDEDYPQPDTFTAGQLLKRRREGKGHPWASDPRRCAMRFVTVHDTAGTFGAEPLTIDFQENPELPANVLEALSTCTLVGHNLDFDLTILRRYGIQVSSSIIDTMLASRLLGLGKEKPKFGPASNEDLSLDEMLPEEEDDQNPVDHDLAATVRRYLGIKIKKDLGASDWGRKDISPDQFAYMAQDISLLPSLWEAMKPELLGAGLEKVFAARMEFFHHLNQVKMTGVPVDGITLEADLQRVSGEKEHKAEELSVMFADLDNTFEIPKSRKKKVQIKTEEGKIELIAGPTHEGFHATCRNQHWIPALASHGIFVENTQEPTLRRIDKPETRALLKYASAAKRLSEINGISRSLFPDGRVRAENWNQLSARTGRMTSACPNLQQVPRDWRNGFRVKPPQLWLKGDLSQIEMLIIAVTTGDQNMIGMIRTGKDIYVEYGSQIFNKKPERGPGDDQITDLLREVAKKPTLGIFYGLTPWGFVHIVRNELNLEYSIEEAGGFFEQYFEMFPGVKAYYDVAEENAHHQDVVHTIAGTRRWLPPLIGEPSDEWEANKAFRKSLAYRRNILLNTPIQGSGADLVIWSANQFMPQLPAGVEIVNLVHDEVDAIVTKETLQATVETITRAFQETFARFYPSSPLTPGIKFSVGPSWGELTKLEL